jgi:hypothetical protein
MKTSLIKLLMMFGDSGSAVECFRQSTIPEVVRISNASSIASIVNVREDDGGVFDQQFSLT